MSLPASVTAQNNVTAPVAGAAIVSISGVTPGFYRVVAAVYLTGAAPAAEDADNARLQVPAADGGQQSGPTLPVVPAQNVVPPFFEIGRFYIGTNGTVSINAIGAGTANVVYRAVLILDPLVN